MNSISSHNDYERSHRQGSVTSLPDEEDQKTAPSDPTTSQQRQDLSSQNRLSSSSSTSYEYSRVLNMDELQPANIEEDYPTPSLNLITIPSTLNEDNTIESWHQLTSTGPQYQDVSQSDSTNDITTSFGFQQSQNPLDNNYTVRRKSPEEVSSEIDYETLIRSKQLYFDPSPQFIRRPQMITPITYKQNIMIKFLKPPPIPQGPLIIREVRPPQPPPPPPLLIRQRPPPPLAPPPIVLREKPPRVPVIMTTQFLTKTLPPLPPPPRSVIIEKLPALPVKPRDIIIERWIPYEFTTQKRKVIVQRAEEHKPHPQPRNIIIEYDNVETQVVRQLQRLGVQPEDPENYSARYGNALLDPEDLLAQAKQLGIIDDLSVPQLIDYEMQNKLTSNLTEQNFSYENTFQPTTSDMNTTNGNGLDHYTMDKVAYGDTDDPTYAPTYENLINGSTLAMNYEDLNEPPSGQENVTEDLSTQLAQYGMTTDSIPY